MTENAQTVKIDGITYKVIENTTPEIAEAKGHPNMAKQMRKVGISNDLVLQRPRGKKFYWTVKSANGSYRIPTRVGL